jgi:Sulfite exporter TauE/SafE
VITDPLFYLVAIPAVTLLGLSKGGFAGLGMISTPLLALVMPPLEGAAILLPILICQDAISVWTYHRAWSAWNLKVLLPGSVLGVGAGWLLASYLSNAAIELTVGSIALVFVLYMWLGTWLRAYLGRPPAQAAAASGHGRSLGRALRLHLDPGAGRFAAISNSHVAAAPGEIHAGRHDGHFLYHPELDEGHSLFRTGPILGAQFRHLGGPAAARRRHQFSRHLARSQNADRAIL